MRWHHADFNVAPLITFKKFANVVEKLQLWNNDVTHIATVLKIVQRNLNKINNIF